MLADGGGQSKNIVWKLLRHARKYITTPGHLLDEQKNGNPLRLHAGALANQMGICEFS